MPQPPHILREKWVQTPDGGELHIFLRNLDFLEEIGGPLGETERKGRVEGTVQRFLGEKYAGSSINKVKVFLGSMLLVTMGGGDLAGKTGLGSQTAYAAGAMQLFLNGVRCVDCTPREQNGHQIVPVRPVAEGLGGTVGFDAATRQVTVTRGALKIVMTIGSDQAVVGGRTVTMESQLTLIGSTSYVSADFLTRQMGAKYVYDTYRSTAVVSMQPSEVYTVQSGDSLWKIAAAHDTTIDAIQLLNGMTAIAGLYAGEKLLVPAHALLYTVQPGDSLWVLAARFNTTVSAIKQANALTSDMLIVGKQLTIPAAAAPAPTAPTPAPAPSAPPPPAENYLRGADPTAVSQLTQASLIFPFQGRTGYDPIRDTWGDTRTYNPATGTYRQHEGTDIMAPAGAPLVAVGNGVITNYGWSELGGWRVTIRLDNTNYSVYYAHMSRYAPGLGKGARVSKGQLLGYVGATGYGPEGTTGKFAPHLHFGLYDNAAGFAAINSYPFLKYWEARL